MDAHHRRTMQPSADPLSNAQRSALPVPSSAMKRSTTQPNPRMSLAGPAQRTMAPNRPRQSLFTSQNVNPLLQSAMKQPAMGRTPLNSSTRRGSLWPGAPAVAAKSTTVQPTKDTRPLRDKQYQTKERTDLLAFLRESSYEHPISMHTLVSIPAKDFRTIFEHLVSFLDPFFPFKQKSQPKFENDFETALKSLRYPFPVDSKNLAAPASMHAWPSLLGVLHWLVELCKEKLHYADSDHPTKQQLDQIPAEFDDPHHHRTWHLHFYATAYDAFLLGADEQEDQFMELESRYTKKTEKIVADLDALRDERNGLRAEFEQLTSAPAPIVELQESNKALLRDRSKFDDVLAHFESRKKKLLDAITNEKAELAAKAALLDQHKNEHSRLDGVIADQNLSPQEVTRMNTEHETLQRSLEDLKRKIDETSKQVYSLEVIVSNRSLAAEEAHEQYDAILYRLGLNPRAPPPHDTILLNLELNTAAEDPKDLLIGDPRLKKGMIESVLKDVANTNRHKRQEVENERVAVEHEIDQVDQEIENLEQDAEALDQRRLNLDEESEGLRVAGQEESAAVHMESARLEKELANARTSALANGMGVKSRLQKVQIAYQEQVDQVARLRNDLLGEIMRNISHIADFKQEVSQSLFNLRAYATNN